MHADTLSPGTQLAGRYRIEDLMGETPRSQTWRAVDRILNRSVSVQVVRSDDGSSDAFLTAARAATAVDDPRFLRVLDAAEEGGHAYVVREWARGVSLDTVLQQGPLPAPRAVGVVREVAEAVASAHRAGVHHGRLDPARVIVKHNGAVRVLGLATDQALHAPTTAPTAAPAAVDGESTAHSNGSSAAIGPLLAEQADVTALGRLLYACLVARWPGGRDLGLPSAPTEHGRLLRARQVRAGVDPDIDTVCDRILGTPPRHHATPLRSAAEVARELAVLADAAETPPSFVDDDDATMARGVLPAAPDASGPPPAIHQVPPPRTGPSAPPVTPAAPEPRTGARGPVWLGIALLVALAAVLAFFVGRVGSDVLPTITGGPPASSTPDRTTPTSGGPLEIASVTDFDPLGDGVEHSEEAPLVTDQDPASVWSTQEYYESPTLGNLKEGVGLLVDLGSPQDVSRVDLTLIGSPTSVEVLAAPGATSAPTGVEGLETLGSTVADGEDPVQASVEADAPVTTRYLVVWLTSLPQVEENVYVGTIAEMAVLE